MFQKSIIKVIRYDIENIVYAELKHLRSTPTKHQREAFFPTGI